MFEHPDDEGFTYSTDSEWDRAEAYQLGELYPERAWVNTDRDVWYKNPLYKGPPVPHPEDYDDEGSCYEPNEVRPPDYYARYEPKSLDIDDEIPF
jgi:hypothetical protein